MAAHSGGSSAFRLTRYIVAATLPTLTVVGTGYALTPIRELRTITTPADFQDWKPIEGFAPGQAAQRELREQTQAKFNATRVVTRDYETPGGSVRFIGAQADFADPRVQLLEHLAGSGVSLQANVESGRLGGAMACGVVPPEQQGATVICGWADLKTLGCLQFFDAAMEPEAAAELTRAFRDEAEVVSRP